MEEEKKNNEGIRIVILIFLILCLIAIVYFMFKMVYVGQNNNSTTPEEKEIEKEKNQFTELTKYTLEEGEEKEITVDGKKITIKRTDNKYYLNDKVIDNSMGFYVTNQIIISFSAGQYGELYWFYNSNLEELDNSIISGYRIEKGLYLDSNKLKFKAKYNPIEWEEGQVIGNIIAVSCEIPSDKTLKKISEYQELIKQHENDIIEGEYQIIYKDNKISIELVESIEKVKDFIENNNNLCVIERSN